MKRTTQVPHKSVTDAPIPQPLYTIAPLSMDGEVLANIRPLGPPGATECPKKNAPRLRRTTPAVEAGPTMKAGQPTTTVELQHDW